MNNDETISLTTFDVIRMLDETGIPEPLRTLVDEYRSGSELLPFEKFWMTAPMPLVEHIRQNHIRHTTDLATCPACFASPENVLAALVA